MQHKDLFGCALLEFYKGKTTEDIITWTNISDEDVLPLSYLFRVFKKMPPIEQYALKECYGTILDVGCGAGSHSLYLQKKGKTVTAIDISKGAIEVSKKRGVKNAKVIALLDVTTTFDTILLLMNGTGIFKEIIQLPIYLQHLKSILNPKGQILIDSSDIAYMFDEKPEKESTYYGELDYYLSYKNEKEAPIKWLYLDFDTLQNACLKVGLHCTKIKEGHHFDFLARINHANH